MRTPQNKDSPLPPSKWKKSRNEKFHKIFKDIPAEEVVLKAYSCAYFGDILLQGYLYLTSNYFCFYSRILVHEKQIVIPVSSVLKITREKTAFIIPNAVGILSKDDKYVFGSLMSREHTYKRLMLIWKGETGEVDGSHSSNDNNNTKHRPRTGDLTPNTTFEDSDDQSECSICIQCGKELEADEVDHICDTLATPSSVASPTDHSPDPPPSGRGPGSDSPGGAPTAKPELLKPTSVATTPSSASGNSQCSSGSLNQLQSSKTFKQLVSKLRGMPRTNLLLLLCVVLLIILVFSAAILGYKILMLQAQLDGSPGWVDPTTSEYVYNQRVYSDIYYLNNRFHTATIQKFHSVLEANIQILDEVHASLKSLQDSPLLKNTCSVAGEGKGS